MKKEARRQMELSKPFGAGRGWPGPRLIGRNFYLTEEEAREARREKVRWNVARFKARKRAARLAAEQQAQKA